MPKKCLYINLDRAGERRRALEANIAAVRHGDWVFERLAAVDGAAEASLPPGKRRPSEIACILSHRAALEKAAALPGPTLIVEDDCEYHQQSLPALDSYLAHAESSGWDLLLLDATIPNPENMVMLFRRRRLQSSGDQPGRYSGRLEVIDLRQMNFGGSMAYVVRPAAAQRLLEALDSLARFDDPYDMILRGLVQRGLVRAGLVFPFLTSSSALGEQSSIQPEADQLTEQSWSAFRRMMWVGAVADDTPRRRRAALPPDFVDDQAAAFADLLAVCLSRNFRAK